MAIEKPHMAKVIRQTLEKFRWKVIPHPMYSPDLSLTNYHLFRSLLNHMREKQFEEDLPLEEGPSLFFYPKSPTFYGSSIYGLPHRWEYVVDHDSEYVFD